VTSQHDVLAEDVVRLQVPIRVALFVGETPGAQLGEPALEALKDPAEETVPIDQGSVAFEEHFERDVDQPRESPNRARI
jgi:hypothetical protein